MDPRLSVPWFLLSSVVVLWDATFLLFRPRSLPGGDLHSIWKPYELYIWVDERYGDMSDTFALAQAWLNLAEICLQLVTVTLILKRNRGALLCGFFVSSLSLWKTVIYMLQYTAICNGSHLVSHLEWSHFIVLFLIPNGIWIIVPAVMCLSYGSKILHILAAYKEKKL